MKFGSLDENSYLLSLILISAIITYGMRLVGYLFSKNIDANSELMRLISAIATAFVAAMVTHIIIFPAGALADSLLINRVIALGFGIIIFLLVRRNLGLAVVASIFAIIVLEVLLRPYY